VESRAARLARGGVAGAFATLTAALSHALAGTAPSGIALGTGLVFGVVAGTFAIGRRASLPRLAVAVGLAQAGYHLVFSFLTPAVATATAHGHHTSWTIEAIDPADRDGAMWLAHAAAGILTLWFLRRAELALWRMLRRALERVLIAVVPVLRPEVRLAAPIPAAPRFLLVPAGDLRHRGPPRR
jgi:hypothetical protein